MTKGVAIKCSRVRVSTSLYEAERGKKPTGEDSWLFRVYGGGRMFRCYGVWSKARRKAMRRASSFGIVDIEVVP